MYDLHEFLLPINRALLNNDKTYSDNQLGNTIKIYEDEIPNGAADVLRIHVQKKTPTGFKIHVDADRELKTYYTLEQMLYRK